MTDEECTLMIRLIRDLKADDVTVEDALKKFRFLRDNEAETRFAYARVTARGAARKPARCSTCGKCPECGK